MVNRVRKLGYIPIAYDIGHPSELNGYLADRSLLRNGYIALFAGLRNGMSAAPIRYGARQSGNLEDKVMGHRGRVCTLESIVRNGRPATGGRG